MRGSLVLESLVLESRFFSVVKSVQRELQAVGSAQLVVDAEQVVSDGMLA